VTQANIITTQDGNFFQSDDADESTPRRHVLPTTQKRHRVRSSSVSLSGTGRNERGEKMGVLKTIQLHARSRHVFAPVETLASAKERLLAEAVDLVDVSPRPLLVRRNSTSAPLSPLLDASTPPIPLPTPPPELDQTTQEQPIATLTPPVNEPTSTSTDTTTQTVTPPPTPQNFSTDEYIAKFASCEKEESAYIVSDTIQKMLQDPTPPKVEQFNAGLHALFRTRRSGEPLTNIIRLYNNMLDASVVPNIETYEILIQALTTRDFEVHHAIMSLELRLKNRPLLGRWEFTNHNLTDARLEKLRAEDNFGSAMSLFESVLAIKGLDVLCRSAFVTLIRSCAFHSNVNAAIHVFAQLERRDKRIDYPVYRYMMLAFSNARMINQAEEIFKAFLKSRPQDRSFSVFSSSYLHNNRHEQIKVWNLMIEAYFRAGMPEKAIELLERMLASTAGDQFGPMDTPIVTPSTFTAVITGFIKSGDISSALAWFERLLAQKQAAANPFEGLGGAPMRPDSTGWHVMIDGLAKKGKIDDLNRLYRVMKSSADQDRLEWRSVDQLILYSANLDNLKGLDDEAAVKILNFILEDLTAPSSKLYIPDNFNLIGYLTIQFVQRGQFLTAAELMRTWFATEYETRSSPSSGALQGMQNNLSHMTQDISTAAKNGKGEIDFGTASIIVQLHRMASLRVTLDFAPWYLHAYGRARFISTIDYSQLTSYDWNILLGCAVEVESAALTGAEGLSVVPRYAFNGVASLLEDIARQGLTFGDLDVELGKRTIELLQARLGDAGCQELFLHLGPSYLEAIKNLDKLKYSALESALTQDSDPIMQITTPQSPISELPPLMINPALSEALDSILRSRGDRSVHERMERGYVLLKRHLMKQQAPEPSVLAYLIQSCGRSMDLDKVRELYTIGQSILQIVSPDLQLDAWVSLENSMIIALAHSGNIDASHVHRLRILDQGRAPSADAYGVLIQFVKDTTDDTSGAITLFQEGLERGMRPNIYLYNNIISKLAKARKADYALELFQQMKANGCTPSSITYSAVIGACARVGDVQLAQTLFTEMARSRFFKPRVPPYNTMMQLFTTTKPNRANSLYYYNELVKARVEPSAYTYKVH
jgi:pentatricopeptide repeat protein